MADLQFCNHGSLVTMTPETDAGRQWISEHIPEDATRLGPAIVIEPRYLEDIVNGARADGLICKG